VLRGAISSLAGRRKNENGWIALKQLKKLKGLRFTFPALSIVLANAMGRGITALSNARAFSEQESLWG